MLIDPDRWRELRIKQHIEALVRAHPSAMYTSDEMALNLVHRGRVTLLRSCFNTFSFTEAHLTEEPRLWHFNTCKPILNAPLSEFSPWMSLFKRDDQKLLQKLEQIHRQVGTADMLAITSDDYHNC